MYHRMEHRGLIKLIKLLVFLSGGILILISIMGTENTTGDIGFLGDAGDEQENGTLCNADGCQSIHEVAGEYVEEVLREAFREMKDTSKSEGRAFRYNHTVFTIFNDRKTSWFTASDLCHLLAPGSHLASLGEKDIQMFFKLVALRNPEIFIDSPNMWIGGFRDGGSWIWSETKEQVPPDSEDEDYPKWIQKPLTLKLNCLSIVKPTSDCNQCGFQFERLECEEKYGFMCRKDEVPVTYEEDWEEEY